MKRIFLYFFRTVILGILGLFFRVPELKLEGTEKGNLSLVNTSFRYP